MLGAFDTKKHVAGAGRLSSRVCHVIRPEAELRFLLGLDVVLEVNAGIERAILLLRFVFDGDFGERQTHILRMAAVAAATVRHAGDDDVVQLDDHELVLDLAGLPMRNRRVFHVRAVGAILQEHRRRLVDVVHEREVVEARLALAAPATRGHRTGVRHPPRVRQHLDLVLVLVVHRLTLDVAELCENV